MDSFSRRLELHEEENMTFKQIQLKVDLPRNTLHQHLEELLEKGLVERCKKPHTTVRRPTFVYNIQ